VAVALVPGVSRGDQLDRVHRPSIVAFAVAALGYASRSLPDAYLCSRLAISV
jgi:hypothetical protein